MTGSAWVEIDEAGRRGAVHHPPTDCDDIRWRLLFSNALLHSSVVIRRSLLDEVGVYNESIGYGEDYELWSRVASRFAVANLARPLVLYRLGGLSKTATIASARAQADAIAGANVDHVAGLRHAWSVSSSAELASEARRLLLSSDTHFDGRAAAELASDILELQRAYATFFRLTPSAANRHRAKITAILASRLRSIGRATGNARTWRAGVRLHADASFRDPSILVRRGRHA